jgi:uncharacterized membrane protein
MFLIITSFNKLLMYLKKVKYYFSKISFYIKLLLFNKL